MRDLCCTALREGRQVQGPSEMRRKATHTSELGKNLEPKFADVEGPD